MGTLHPFRTKNGSRLRVITSESTTSSLFSQDKKRCQNRCVLLSLGALGSQSVPVTLQIGDKDKVPEVAIAGWLPPAEPVLAAYERWQQCYWQMLACDSRFASRLSVPAVQVTNVSVREVLQRCYLAEDSLSSCINQWLNSEAFRPVRETLLAYCHPSESIRVLLKTDDLQIQKLPLHKWDWFERYSQAELVLSSATYANSSRLGQTPSSHLRVLAVLGNSRGLDVEADLSLLNNLPDASVTCLREPSRLQLNETLWDGCWDIILFAGHSDRNEQHKTKLNFKLNEQERLSLNELKYALKTAIARNLKLLILNTCDSLSLIQDLSDLCLPATIAMRQAVPDVVAQTFLRYFLSALSNRQSLCASVREAREKLQGIEHQFPFSSSIPVLYQTL